MHKMDELREMLCEELDKITKKGELSSMGDVELVDKLTHSIKSIDTIMAMEDAGYSQDYSRAYSRGRRTARRDSMGRYSSEGYSMNEELVSELRDMMNSAPDEKTRQEFHRFINKIQSM